MFESRKEKTVMTQFVASQSEPRTFVKNVHGIRYQVKDVARAIATMQVRGAPLIGIAAAMGLVAVTAATKSSLALPPR